MNVRTPEAERSKPLPDTDRQPAIDTTPPEVIIRRDPPPVSREIDPVIASTNAALLDAFFAYDRSGLDATAIAALRKDADLLRPILAEFPQLRITVEGHCDERGSAEYNLGLGDQRARRAADLLERFGIPAGRIQTVSYGKESPQCTEAVESCWSRNRRAHLAVLGTPPPSFTLPPPNSSPAFY